MEEKIVFHTDDGDEEFFILEQTKIGGVNYLLVADSQEEEADCYIFQDTSESGDPEALYEMVEDPEQLDALSKVFAQLMDDVEIV